jgi:hypothetical protein
MSALNKGQASSPVLAGLTRVSQADAKAPVASGRPGDPSKLGRRGRRGRSNARRASPRQRWS